MTDLIETTPKMDLAIQDIAHLVEDLRAYHAIYSPLFQRREQREAAHTYLQGLLATLPRKSIEPMVLAVEGVAPQGGAGHAAFISEGQWNDEAAVAPALERSGEGPGDRRGGADGRWQ